MVGIGVFKGKDEATTDDFFLGGHSVPAWAACLSFVATEISAVTIINVPSTAYHENWNYAQFFIGSASSRIVLAYLFIPAFFKYNCTTIYEFLLHRFGPMTQRAGSIFFFVTRLTGSAVRLYVAANAIGALVGMGLEASLLFFTLLGIVYIAFGGIKAVVWTNVVQALSFIVGGVATLIFLNHAIPGGLANAFAVSSAEGKTAIINWGPKAANAGWTDFLGDPNWIVIAILNGFFGSLAAFGTDHDLMQRLLTVKTRAESQRTILGTILGSFAILCIYLTIGMALYSFYKLVPGVTPPVKFDEVLQHFIGTAMPAGLRGLMLAVILLASIDSPLGSLSASFVTDIYRPLLVRDRDDRHYLNVGRVAVIIFGIILGVLAWMCKYATDMLWLAFQIGGVTFGSLLGVFLLGLLTHRQGDRGNVIAMVVVALAMAALLAAIKLKMLALGWSWLIIIGTISTMVIAWALGRPPTVAEANESAR